TNGTLTITKATQTLSFAPLADRTYGDAPFAVIASASSGLPVGFSASGSCTVSGSTVTLTGAGGCTITATQVGGANYLAAAPLARTFQVRAPAAPPADEMAAAPALPAPPAAPVVRQGGTSVTRSFLHTLGGAVVGAWLGLVTSQVVKSDWDKRSNAEVANHRAYFSLGGALFGGAGGMLIGSRPSSEMAAGLRQARRQEQQVITLEQIQAANVGNVYEVVQSLHPEWLRVRGLQSGSEATTIQGGANQPTIVTPGLPTIIAYLDNSRLGGVEALRLIAAADAESVQFLNPSQATYRWGTGHHHGAIVVNSRK
ncbi:MAG TPA: hypothetical protein VHG51_21450, partial [Longimicrobiaceae bacterium]|nr:hypothetical protein [Longimicrobiaceae bacterium]